MKEIRPLVWLSAEYTDLSTQAAELREWRLIPIAIDTELRKGDLPSDNTWVGVFDVSELSSDQLAVASSWLEALGSNTGLPFLIPAKLIIRKSAALSTVTARITTPYRFSLSGSTGYLATYGACLNFMQELHAEHP